MKVLCLEKIVKCASGVGLVSRLCYFSPNNRAEESG